MRLHVHPDNPPARKLQQAADILKNGGTAIYPTDTIYAIGCAIGRQDAVEKICRLRGLKPENANLSIICSGISQLSDYAAQLDSHLFREMKRRLPGPYTFILNGTNRLPKIFKNKKRTIGIRIPDHAVPIGLVEMLGEPILTASLKIDDGIAEYPTDIEDIVSAYEKQVDVIIDSGNGGNVPSTIIDCTDNELTVARQGLGAWDS